MEFEVGQIDAVFLTHAHLDHCGYLPAIVKKGFSGKIIATKATKEIVQVILVDSVRVQEYEKKEHPEREILYSENDVARTMQLFEVKAFDKKYQLNDIEYKYFEAGHLLGVSSIVFEAEGKRLCFSGDIGRREDILHNSPTFTDLIDYLVLESTYGDREHHHEDVIEELRKHVLRIRESKGGLLIPSFAVARIQNLITYFFSTF